MPTFITVLYHNVALGVEGDSLYRVAQGLGEIMLENGVSGNKIVITLSAVRGADDEAFHLATVNLLNIRRRVLDKALVWAEKPMVARQQRHATGGDPITCRECGGDLFYNVDRSLFYENHICAKCWHPAQTITETGAST